MTDLLELVDPEQEPMELYGQRFTHHYADAHRQAVDASSMSADFVILTNKPNHHGNQHQITESKMGKGLLTQRHEQNPVVLLEHGFTGIPFPAIGLSRDKGGKYTVKKQKTKATATVFFSQSNPDAATVFAMVDEGVLHMSSIGFDAVKGMPLKQNRPPELPDGVVDLTWPDRGILFTETELVEWSIVSQGADPGAVRQYLDRGKVGTEKLTDRMRAYLQAISEPKKATGIGWTPENEPENPKPKTENQSVCVTIVDDLKIEGPREEVQAILDSMDRQSALDTTPDGDTVSTPTGENGEGESDSVPPQSPPPTLPDLAGQFDQLQSQQSWQKFQEALLEQVETLVVKKIDDLAQGQQQIQENLNRHLGILD